MFPVDNVDIPSVVLIVALDLVVTEGSIVTGSPGDVAEDCVVEREVEGGVVTGISPIQQAWKNEHKFNKSHVEIKQRIHP